MKSKLLSLLFLTLIVIIPCRLISQTTCTAPSGLTTTTITATGATLAWVSAAPSFAYLVQYRPITTPEAAWITVTATQSTVTLTNLVCGTHYQWHVASFCGNSTTTPSPYSAMTDFTTVSCTSNCSPPVGLVTTNISTTAATLGWAGAPASIAYLVQYRPITTPESAWINVTTQNPSITLTNLVCGKHYQWHVQALCGSTGTTTPSPYSITIDFTTAACTTCTAPANLTTTNITTTGATLAWVSAAPSFAYIVQYRPVTTPEAAWTTVTTQTPSITLTNLGCGTHYQWHVAAYCGNSTTTPSPYSAIVDFTTAACTITCNAPVALPATNITATSAILSWTGSAGSLAYHIQYRPITTPESAWINVTSQSPSITITNLVCGTHYQWHVQAYCANTGTTNPSPYSVILDFNTTTCTTTCQAPTGLIATNITTTTTTLSWIAVTGAPGYVIQYRPVTNPESPWININTQNPSTTFTIGNLHCGTLYQWHVAALCGNSTTPQSPYSALADFTTAACTTTCTAPVALPATNITATGVTLSWTGAAGSLAYHIQYRPITIPESDWINLTSQTPSITITNLVCGTNYQWHVQANCGTTGTTNLSPYSAIHDFHTVACTVTCPAPSGLTTTNITASGASLTWTGAATSFAYIVQYRPITTPESAWINVTSQNSSITLTNLVCGTHYQWHVAAYCGNNTSAPSPYSGIIDFTTAACTPTCTAPVALPATNITATSATLSWTGPSGSLAYHIQYRPITTPESAWINVSSQTSSISLTNLVCGTHYQWHVQAYCGTASTSVSPYSTTLDFTTAPCTSTCPAPTGLITTNVGTTTATLSWIAVTGAPGYVIQYRPVTTPESAWININTQNPSTTFTIGNLHCGTLYQWHVAARCNNGTSVIGPYSTPINFTTTPCTTNCSPPTGLVTTNISATGATVLWAGAPGALAYLVQYRPITTPESAWINITSQVPSVTLANLVCGKHYQWHVQAYCGSAAPNLSPYSITIDFTTLPCNNNVCPIPTGLTSSILTTTPGSRLLSWNSTGALAYYIRYRITGTATWTTIVSTTNSKLVTGLQATSHYEWQVQSVCSTNSGNVITSDWSQLSFFETPFRGIFPNPASGSYIQVPVETENEASVHIIISDQTGRVAKSIDKTIVPGGSYVNIDIANLDAGIYFIQVRGTNNNEVQKLFITR